MNREREDAIDKARSLGLNQLEAEVYAYLLPHEPATAYAIGKAIGRPTANVYKAADRLAELGAVLIEEGTSRVCRAVPVAEFIRHTEREFAARAQAAGQALALLQRETYDERVYRVESVPETFARARAMLARCEKIAVVDAFPLALAELQSEIATAAARGIQIFVEAYRQIGIPGAQIVLVPDGERSIAAWRSQQLNLVIDGREHLLALLSEDLRSVHQAVWSSSVYLSCLHHAGRMSEIMLIQRMNELAAAGDAASSEALAGNQFFRASEVPGHRELLQRFAPPQAAATGAPE